MGQVFLAEHGETLQRVALKIASIGDPGVVASARKEFSALARLDHPAVVRVMSAGVSDGLPWYAMEWIDGRPLSDLFTHGACRDSHETGPAGRDATPPTAPTVADAPLAGMRTARLSPEREETAAEQMSVYPGQTAPRLDLIPHLRHVCDALAYIHGMGVVHRDLKPDNLMIRKDDRIVLVDFGLVDASRVALAGREQLSTVLAFAGTAAYMAPEQIEGRWVDARADLYALGCMLYEAVTGRVPFAADSVAQLMSHKLALDPVPPSVVCGPLVTGLEQLILDLLARDPERRPPYASEVGARLDELLALDPPRPHSVAPRAYLYRPRCSGRSGPLELLGSQVARLENGRGGVILIGGESGGGKTRLALEFVRSPGVSDIRIMTGDCMPPSSLQEEQGLQPLRDVFTCIADVCRQSGRYGTRRLLGDEGGLLARFSPAIAQLPGLSTDVAAGPLGEDAPTRLFRALSAVFERLSRQKRLVLVLDDIQWADELTLGWLASLGARHSQRPFALLVIGMFRTATTSSSLHALRSTPGVRELLLAPLDREAVSDMVASMLATHQPPESLVSFLASASFGNPFFVAEYLRVAVQSGMIERSSTGSWRVSSTLEADASREQLSHRVMLMNLLQRRFESLSRPARQTLDFAAIIGRNVEQDLLARCIDRDAVDAVDELLVTDLLEADGSGRIRFTHDRIRETTYALMSPELRRANHGVVAGAIASTATATAPRWAQRAHHWERAGNLAYASMCYLRAAEDASRHYRYGEAARLLEARLRALPVGSPDAVETQLALGEALLESSHPRQARRAGARLLRDATDRDDAHVARAALLVAAAQLQLGRAAQGLATLARHEQRFHAAGTPALQAQLLTRRATLYTAISRYDEAVELHEQALAIYESRGDAVARSSCLQHLAQLHTTRDEYALAQDRAEAALASCRELGDRRNEGRVLAVLASTRLHQGALDEARDLLDRAIAIQRAVGDRAAQARSTADLGAVLIDQGDAKRAVTLLEHAVEISREIDSGGDVAFILLYLADALCSAERPTDAHPLIDEALAYYRQSGRRLTLGYGYVQRCVAHRLTGELDDAEAALLDAERLLFDFDDAYAHIYAHCERGQVELARGRSPMSALTSARRAADSIDIGAQSPPMRRITELASAMSDAEPSKR